MSAIRILEIKRIYRRLEIKTTDHEIHKVISTIYCLAQKGEKVESEQTHCAGRLAMANHGAPDGSPS